MRKLVDCLTTIVTAAIARDLPVTPVTPVGVKRVSRVREKRRGSKHDDDDDQRDSYREGHYLHFARLLRDDASYGLGDTDVGISLER